jgi:DNA helicase-2/ATP-dependent DNA helicase PcrA
MTVNADDPLTSFDLNAEQFAASTTTSVNTLVLAGAGTGKTRTVVARIAHLIASGTAPTRIVALTFTRASANEMAGRVSALVGDRSQGLVATTFHAWAHRLIRVHPEVFGYDGWSVIDADDQVALMTMIRGKRKRGAFPTSRELISAYSFARNTGMPLVEALELRLPGYPECTDEIVEIAKNYSARKLQRSYLDFDDILVILATTLETRPDVAVWLGQNVDHLLIDEMQDTNPLQWRIIDRLVSHLNLFAVGDDAQSIYGFRGADFESIHSFSKRVPGATVLPLVENYRSTQEILDLSNWLLDQSPLGYNKRLRAVRGSGRKPEILKFDDKFAEAGWVAEDILSGRDAGLAWRDHLALVRTNFSGRALESALLGRNIPYRYLGGTKLLESAHVRDVLSVLRVSANVRDDLAWARMLMLLPGVGEVSATRAIESVLVAVEDGASPIEARDRARPALGEALFSALLQVDELQSQVATAIDVALEALDPILMNHYPKDWNARRRDFEPLKHLARTQRGIAEFIAEYLINPVYVSRVEPTTTDDAVTIATVHSAKGLEAIRAYVLNVSPGTYPWSRASDNSEIEEERRVLYVALTRAKDYLAITRAAYRSNVTESAIDDGAYFLAELPGDLAVLVDQPLPGFGTTTFTGSPPQEVNLDFA